MRIYFDYNATTPMAPDVVEALSAASRDHFGNASSVLVVLTVVLGPERVRELVPIVTALVSVMHDNNQIATIQPIAEIDAIAHAQGAIVHTDAVQSVRKIPVDLRALGVHLLSLS